MVKAPRSAAHATGTAGSGSGAGAPARADRPWVQMYTVPSVARAAVCRAPAASSRSGTPPSMPACSTPPPTVLTPSSAVSAAR
jgi:hypothetical protein